MKKFLLIFALWIPVFSNAQIGFKQLLDGIDWNGTEKQLLAKYGKYTTKTTHEEWSDEGSCSDYSFRNVKLGGFVINQAPIRVDKETKELYRVNFIVYEDSKNANLSKIVDRQLVALFGTPISTEDDEGIGVISTYHKEWVANKYKVRSNLFVFNGDTYLYTISVEPIEYYPVDYTKAKVEHNGYGIAVPKIVSFKIDNDGNVYIKKEGGIEVKKKFENIHETPKGDVFVFDGGMICYREADNDIVYMQDSFAATYPIKKQ